MAGGQVLISGIDEYFHFWVIPGRRAEGAILGPRIQSNYPGDSAMRTDPNHNNKILRSLSNLTD